MQNKKGPQRLIGEVQLLRIRSAAAESRLKVLRVQAREAKRRRKVAKRLAQRARKVFKRSKDELAQLKQALARAEAKLFKAAGRKMARKLTTSAPVTKSTVRSSKKLKAPASKVRRTPSRTPVGSVSATRKRPPVPRKKAIAQSRPARLAPKPTPVVSHINAEPSTVYEQDPPDQRTEEAEDQKV
jgi:hypothetical protein